MIEDPEIAAQVDAAIRKAWKTLDDSAALVRERCTEAEIEHYLKRVGPVMYEMISQLWEPLYEKHPGLKPANWD